VVAELGLPDRGELDAGLAEQMLPFPQFVQAAGGQPEVIKAGGELLQ
jgi:hypothetical protein